MSYIGTSKVGGMYLGDTKIGKAYLGEDLVFSGAPAFALPIFSPDSGAEFTDSGDVAISAVDALAIYYTTDGTTPTTSSTLYSTPITLSADTTIKAIAVYQDGQSGVAEASYTVVEDQIIIDTTVTTTSVTLGGQTFALNSSERPSDNNSYYRNIIKRSDLTNAGVTTKSLTMKFSDNRKIARFYGGGFKFTTAQGTDYLFGVYTSAASSLKYCDIEVYTTGTQIWNYWFYGIGTGNWGSLSLKVKGDVYGFNYGIHSAQTNFAMTVDISGLSPTSSDGFKSVSKAFGNNCTTLIIGENFKVAANASGTSTMFSSGTKLSTLKVMSTVPLDVSSSSVYNWLSNLMGKFPSASIKVPSGCAETYKNTSGWSDYASRISEYT